jgi:hypothetical protein
MRRGTPQQEKASFGTLVLLDTHVKLFGKRLRRLGAIPKYEVETAISPRKLDAVAGGVCQRSCPPISCGVSDFIVKIPPAFRAVLTEWSLISALMAETLLESRCAAFQRNFAWMGVLGLVREVTGQGRFRMWRTKNRWPQQSLVSLSAAPLTF